MSQEYYNIFTITYETTTFPVGIVDRSTGEWEACSNNDLFNEYVNNDSERFDAYDALVQVQMHTIKKATNRLVSDFKNPLISEQNA